MQRNDRWNRKKALRAGVAIGIYGALLLVLAVFVLTDRQDAETAAYGSLDGRFESEIRIEHDGASFFYREREVTNYLLIGVDSNEGSSGQADFLVLLSVDRRSKSITPVMVDRDTMAMVATYGVLGDTSGEKQMQICLAQAFRGRSVTGSRNTAAALSRLLMGVKVDHYVAVDMGGIALLNDAVGGVEITLEDDFTSLDPSMKKGETILLDGTQAEYFVRGRTTVADGSNATRMKHQRRYLAGMLEKLSVQPKQKSLYQETLHALSGHIETDMTENALLSDMDKYAGYVWSDFVSFPGEYRVGEDGFTEFWLDEAQTENIIVNMWFRQAGREEEDE